MKKMMSLLFLTTMYCCSPAHIQHQNQKEMTACAEREIYRRTYSGQFTNELYYTKRKEDLLYLEIQFITKDSIFSLPNYHLIVRKKDCKVIYEGYSYGKPIKDTCINIYNYDKK